jgi:hypothetical protein
MEPASDRALRKIEEMRLQLVVDRLVASGVLRPDAAVRSSEGLERVLGERGLLGLDLDGQRREARQQRRQARRQRLDAVAQRQIAAAQSARVVDILDPTDRSPSACDAGRRQA